MRQDNRFPREETPSLWYKDAIIYQVHPRAYYDKNGDGMGDFRGLTEKLDYIKDLGVTAVWLLPFYPSPLRDDGYDIADYSSINPIYGNLRDFRQFLKEAHNRDLQVITELVINHTSDQHAWFQRARQEASGNRWRNFYVWSGTSEKYRGARIIFRDFEPSNWTWDPVASAYYWHRFYYHQPDLNFDSPQVQRAVIRTLDFWMKMGVDGVRLDAIPYLYEREGTSCENLPETHAFLKQLRKHVERHYPGRMLLAEANQWPEDAVSYFGNGDECHMAFHFPVMPRLFMAMRMEDRYPIIDIMQQTPPIPDICQWAMFLRNHDELTLEMVTDEERDYMYRVYARDRQSRINLGIRRRLAPLVENDRRKIELLNGLLFSLPGAPVLYYGDEIGMGDNIYLGDRNGVRTPMQWSADRNAGFSRANPQQLYSPIIIDPDYHYEIVNVESQQRNPNSLLWWMKRLIALRKRFKAFSRGSLEFLSPNNGKVLAFLRRYQEEVILVVANLSRYSEYVELDLSHCKGMTPVELVGRKRFPAIGELPYFLTLGPYDIYWFALEPERVEQMTLAGQVGARSRAPLPALVATRAWEDILRRENKSGLEAILPSYLATCSWFGGKGRIISSAQIIDAVPAPTDEPEAFIALVQVDYAEGEPETYSLPITYAAGERVLQMQNEAPHAVIARLRVRSEGEEGVLYDALWDKTTAVNLLQAINRQRRFRGDGSQITAFPTDAFRPLYGLASGALETSTLKMEQNNTSIVYRDQANWNLFILKFFRRLEPGTNPDLELGRFLTERENFTCIPPVAGALEYRQGNAEPVTLAILNGFVPNEGDLWQYTLDNLAGYFDQVLAHPEAKSPPLTQQALLDLVESDVPPIANDLVGHYLEMVRLLGQRTAEMHVALASDRRDPNFSPEPSTDFTRRSRYQSMRNLTNQVFQSLRWQLKDLPEGVRSDAEKVLGLESQILSRFRAVIDRRAAATRIRCHGDYHLEQVLFTGRDFLIIDFEGEVARPISQRRLKASPLLDVASMLRSFHYAAYAALLDETSTAVRPEDVPVLERWSWLWYLWVSATFLRGYLEVKEAAALLPENREHLEVLLNARLIEKAVYEVGHEINNRPDWLKVPLQGILQMMESGA